MNKILKEKISESVSSVLPITIIVLLLSVTIAPMPVGTMVSVFNRCGAAHRRHGHCFTRHGRIYDAYG